MSETTMHRAWQVQEAEHRFGILRAVGRGGPQIITRHREPVGSRPRCGRVPATDG